MLHAQLATLAFAALTLAASGCGGSTKSHSSSSSASTVPTANATTSTTSTPTATADSTTVALKVATGKPLTRAQWITRGDAICARTRTQLSATTAKTLNEFARKLPEAAAYYQAELASLGRLVPPASKINDWQQFLSGTQQIVENISKLAEAAQTRQVALHEPEVDTVNKIQETITRVVKRDGFRVCSRV